MEKIFICQQCHAELGEDEVDGILGHAVPDYDEDGDVDGCNQCGPCELNRDWALARIKSLKDCAAKMQKRILELEAEISERRLDYTEDCKRLDAAINDLEHQLATANKHIAELEIAAGNLSHAAAKLQAQMNDATPYAELEVQLAKANDNLYYALELAIAHAPAKADVEWAAGLIERMDQPAPTKEEERDGEI